MPTTIARLTVITVIATTALLNPTVRAEAAEIRLTCTHALKTVVLDLVPQFEKMTGHKVIMRFDVVGGVRRQVAAGDAFDIACLNPSMMEEQIKSGKIDAGSSVNIARVAMGVAVRTGALKPDISSVEAFKQTLLRAKSVAHSREGESGAYFKILIDRLGIAEQLNPKLIPTPSGGATAAVVNGEAEMVVVVISTIMADPEVTLVGPLPLELQSYSTFSAGISASSKEPQAAEALIKHLTGPTAAPVVKLRGMEPAQ